MTDDGRLLRLLAGVLDEYPKLAPDELLVRVLDDVRTARQRPRWLMVPTWRRSSSNAAWAAIVGAAAVLAIAIGIVAYTPLAHPSGTQLPSATPGRSVVPSLPAATPPAAFKVAPEYTVMDPGRYLMPEPNTDHAGTWPTRVIVTVPAGWTQWGPARGGGILVGDGDVLAGARLAFGQLGSLDCGPSAGQTVDDLVGALLSEVGRPGVGPRPATDITIDGYPGKRLEFVAPEFGASGCQASSGWETPAGGERWTYPWTPGSHHQLSIVDVDGVRFVIDASLAPGATTSLQADLQSIVDSTELPTEIGPIPGASPA